MMVVGGGEGESQRASARRRLFLLLRPSALPSSSCRPVVSPSFSLSLGLSLPPPSLPPSLPPSPPLPPSLAFPNPHLLATAQSLGCALATADTNSTRGWRDLHERAGKGGEKGARNGSARNPRRLFLGPPQDLALCISSTRLQAKNDRDLVPFLPGQEGHQLGRTASRDDENTRCRLVERAVVT